MLGTKEDFELIRQQINIEAVANHLMKKQGKNYIFPSEKSASVRIYPETQSFYDFGRCTGGDVIRLWSHVRDVDSWTALCQIREIFGLNTPDRKNSRDLIRQQEQARQKQQQAEKAEKRRWRLQVEALQGEFIPVDMQMGQRNAMRACLSPLIGIGEQYGVTSLIVVHTNKKQGVFGRNRIADSADVWDIARSVMIVGSVPGSNERYLSQEKSNYGPLSQTVLFNIGEKGAEFTGFSDKHDADYVGMRDYERRQAPQRADAEQFIIDFLNNGKKTTAELDESAEAAGISKNTLSRAKTELRKKKILGSKAEGFGNSKVFYSYLLSTSH